MLSIAIVYQCLFSFGFNFIDFLEKKNSFIWNTWLTTFLWCHLTCSSNSGILSVVMCVDREEAQGAKAQRQMYSIWRVLIFYRWNSQGKKCSAHLLSGDVKKKSLIKISLNLSSKKVIVRFRTWINSSLVLRERKRISDAVCILSYPIIQFSSVTQSCPTLCDPMNRSTPGLPVHHYLPEFTQTHVHRVRDAIQPSHPLSSPSPPAPNPSQHQSLFQWVNYPHEVAKVLEFQL